MISPFDTSERDFMARSELGGTLSLYSLLFPTVIIQLLTELEMNRFDTNAIMCFAIMRPAGGLLRAREVEANENHRRQIMFIHTLRTSEFIFVRLRDTFHWAK